MDLLDILIFLIKYKGEISTFMLYYNMFNYTYWTLKMTSKVPVYMYKRITYKPNQEPPEDWEIINETEKSDL